MKTNNDEADDNKNDHPSNPPHYPPRLVSRGMAKNIVILFGLSLLFSCIQLWDTTKYQRTVFLDTATTQATATTTTTSVHQKFHEMEGLIALEEQAGHHQHEDADMSVAKDYIQEEEGVKEVDDATSQASSAITRESRPDLEKKEELNSTGVQTISAHREKTRNINNNNGDSNLSNGSTAPDLVIFGIGDSGTRGLHDFIQQSGQVMMCGGPRNPSEFKATKDCNPTKSCHSIDYLKQLWTNSNQTLPPQLNLLQQSNPAAFQNVVECEQNQSQILMKQTQNQLMDLGQNSSQHEDYPSSRNFFYGYKNPRHAYIVPIIQHAFQNQTKMILLLRHPYDICTGDNRGQYNSFGQWLNQSSSNTTGDPSSPDKVSCMEFWYILVKQLLEYATTQAPNIMKLTRIETLVLGNEERRRQSAKCMANLVGYNYNHRNMMKATSIMQKFNSSYGGFAAYKDSTQARHKKKVRQQIEDTKFYMHELASQIGYNLSSYGKWQNIEDFLPTPRSLMVC